MPMGEAVALEPADLIGRQRPAKFVKKSRFPQASFADDTDDLTVARLCPRQPIAENVELAIPPDERGQPALRTDIEATAPAAPTRHLVDRDRSALALHLDGPQ